MNKFRHGFARYTQAILDGTARFLDSEGLRHPTSEMVTICANHLFNLPGPRSISSGNASLSEIYYGFTEISESYDRLKDFIVYIKRFPYSGTRVSPFRHLGYTISNYYDETYILQQRLLTYLERIRKHVLRRPAETAVSQYFEKLKQVVLKLMRGVVQLRGSHVHKSRFSDDDLRRLQTLELLIRHGKMRHFSSFYRFELDRTRTKWSETTQRNNGKAIELLDVYFGFLYPFVFGPRLSLFGSSWN